MDAIQVYQRRIHFMQTLLKTVSDERQGENRFGQLGNNKIRLSFVMRIHFVIYSMSVREIIT